jgi:uncharacterized protein YkwD
MKEQTTRNEIHCFSHNFNQHPNSQSRLYYNYTSNMNVSQNSTSKSNRSSKSNITCHTSVTTDSSGSSSDNSTSNPSYTLVRSLHSSLHLEDSDNDSVYHSTKTIKRTNVNSTEKNRKITTKPSSVVQNQSEPCWWHTSNGHVMINRDRAVSRVPALYRSRRLDALAHEHAQCMAQEQAVFHSVDSLNALQLKLDSKEVGENIQRGLSIQKMHHAMTWGSDSSPNRSNIISQKFNECGMGTAKGKDGLLYMVQLFRHS